jgi:hypothetical protein
MTHLDQLWIKTLETAQQGFADTFGALPAPRLRETAPT